jgi:hypothetical protein
MAETIFLLNHNGELVEMTESHYLTENDLQKLLADYPSLISGDQIDKENPRRWLLVSREMGVADGQSTATRWSLDHLFIDQDEIPTLLEVKRSSDTRIRREVIGQILDYAANAVSYWSIEEIISKFRLTCEIGGQDADKILDTFLTESFFKDKFWETVDSNLKSGKIRLLLIADVIPREMQRIIEFLNEQMSPCEILGMEIKQFLGQNLKTLVPRVIGSTINAKNQKAIKTSSGNNQWNEEKFFEEINRKFPKQVSTYKILYSKSVELFDDIWWGNGSGTGSFIPNLKINGLFIQLYSVYTYGSVEIQFQYLKNKPPFDDEAKRYELLEKINLALGTNINTIDKRPNIKTEEFEKPGVLDAFFEVVKWYINTVKAYYKSQ